MSHNLRAKLSGLRYKKIISDKDYDRLCKALDNEKTLDKIRAEIDAQREKLKIMADDDWYAGKIRGYDCAIEIIDKYKASPTGHWIELPTHESQSGLPWYECSECNSERCIAVLRDFKYCPNCGAKMAESEDVG